MTDASELWHYGQGRSLSRDPFFTVFAGTFVGVCVDHCPSGSLSQNLTHGTLPSGERRWFSAGALPGAQKGAKNLEMRISADGDR